MHYFDPTILGKIDLKEITQQLILPNMVSKLSKHMGKTGNDK
jgi:hypothetical protein